MENNAENILCNNLIHVVCLPFNITKPDNNKPPRCLDEVVKALEGSPWQEGATPDDDKPWGELRDYQSRAYFHPFVRRFLHDRGQVKRFHRRDIDRIEVILNKEESVTLCCLRCELVLFQPDIGVLLLETSPPGPLNLRKTQLLLDRFRRLYPPYVEDHPIWHGGHCPFKVTLLSKCGKKIGDLGTYQGENHDFIQPYKEVLLADHTGRRPRYPWAAHWQQLLQPFNCSCIGENGFRAQQLGDDRAPILSWVAFDDPRAVDRGNWMRLCFADQPGSDCLPYAHAFTGGFEKKYCYDRYWYEPGESTDAPSRILNCGYAFCFAGSSQDKYFFTNEKNGAHAIFRYIHVEMGLIAHFQKAALLSMSQRLSELVTREGKNKNIRLPDPQEVRDFYDHFVEFTQNFWFDEITPQQQGQELFQMWREHLRLQEIYNEVRQELKDLVDYSELRASNRLNQVVLIVGAVGLAIAALSLLAGIFGMNDPNVMDWLPKWLPYISPTPIAALSQAGISFALMSLTGTAAYVLYRLFRNIKPNKLF